MTHRVDAIDKENFTISYTVIDGDVLTSGIESISHEVKVMASPDGGCIYKNPANTTPRTMLRSVRSTLRVAKRRVSHCSRLLKPTSQHILTNIKQKILLSSTNIETILF